MEAMKRERTIDRSKEREKKERENQERKSGVVLLRDVRRARWK